MVEQKAHRSGFVAIAGRANAGKSTLLNAILGQKLSIVSPKPQTTRNRILGIRTERDLQAIFVDTPGLGRAREELGRRMERGARQAVAEADVVVWLSDAARGDRDLADARALIEEAGRPALVALNKVDLVRPKDRLLPLIERWAALPGVSAVVPVSALKGGGVDQLLAEVEALLPEGPALFPEDMLTDRPERFVAGELVREQVLGLTEQEVPHAVAVQVTSWREVEGEAHVEATILVEKQSQKGILIGKGGSMIKSIGQAARAEMARVLGEAVHLRLRVAVSEGWRADPRALDELGYDE